MLFRSFPFLFQAIVTISAILLLGWCVTDSLIPFLYLQWHQPWIWLSAFCSKTRWSSITIDFCLWWSQCEWNVSQGSIVLGDLQNKQRVKKNTNHLNPYLDYLLSGCNPRWPGQVLTKLKTGLHCIWVKPKPGWDPICKTRARDLIFKTWAWD